MLALVSLSGTAQNVFGYDPYDTLKAITIKANLELCKNEIIKSKDIISADSLFEGLLTGKKNTCGFVVMRKGKSALKTSSKKNTFKIAVFDMEFEGKFDEKTGEILNFIGKSKGMKYKVTANGTNYYLEEIKFKEKKGNQNQVDELRKNISTLISFVKQFILVPNDLCLKKI